MKLGTMKGTMAELLVGGLIFSSLNSPASSDFGCTP